MVTNLVGGVARGEDFFGREALVEILWEKLEKGHVLLAAPRRFGKTSLMYRLLDDPKPGFRVIHADLEHMTEPAELITELVMQLARNTVLSKLFRGMRGLTERLWNAFRATVEEVELLDAKLKLRASVRPHWKESGEELFKRLAASPDRVVFILDEFPMMIDRMAGSEESRGEAITLLRWLRSIRVSPEGQQARFLLGGSIGIDHILNQLGEIASVNDFERLRIDPFSAKTAMAFLDTLSTGADLNLSRGVKTAIIELVGTPVPYFLQILFSEIYKVARLQQIRITPKCVEAIYRDRVLGIDCKTYFDHYYGRIRDYYAPEDARAVRRLLRELALGGALPRDVCFQHYKAETGPEPDALQESFNALMTNLENDFYIQFDFETKRYTFSCKILRDWWLRHYGLDSAS